MLHYTNSIVSQDSLNLVKCREKRSCQYLCFLGIFVKAVVIWKIKPLRYSSHSGLKGWIWMWLNERISACFASSVSFFFFFIHRPQIPASDELCHILTVHRSTTPPDTAPSPPLNLSQSPPDLQPAAPFPHSPPDSAPVTALTSHTILPSPETLTTSIAPSLGLPSAFSSALPTQLAPSDPTTPPQALSPPPPDFTPPPAELLGSDDEEQENPADYCKGIRLGGVLVNPFLRI